MIDARDHLVAQCRIEVDAVGVEQQERGVVVPLGLDPLHLGEQPADALAKRLGIGHHVVGLAAARPHLDRRGVRHQPVDDHLAVAHVVFFDVRALADPPQLDQRVARVALVLGAHDLVVRIIRHQAELDQLSIGQEIQRD